MLLADDRLPRPRCGHPGRAASGRWPSLGAGRKPLFCYCIPVCEQILERESQRKITVVFYVALTLK